MGRYFQEPTKAALDLVGREIHTNYDANYATILSMTSPGEELVGLYNRGLFNIAPYLYDEREFIEFERQYNEGLLLARTLYAVKREGGNP